MLTYATNKNFEPDMTYVENTLNEVSDYFKRGSLICLESTTYPGTTEDICKKLNKKFFNCEDIFRIFTRKEDPGNKKFSIDKITKVVSGYTKNCLNLMEKLYQLSQNT